MFMIVQCYKVISRLIQKCNEDNISAVAAQSTYFLILSFIPALMVVCSMLKFTPVTESVLLKLIHELLPTYISPFVSGIIHEFYSKSMGIVSATALVALWSAAKGIQYITDGFNVICGIGKVKSWIVLRIWAVLYTFLFFVGIVAALVLLVFGNSIQEILVGYWPILANATNLFFKFRSIMMIVVLSLIFALMYRFLPNNKTLEEHGIYLKFVYQLPGAVFCAVSWYLFSFGLSVYVDYFNGFSMYGSLTTVLLVMLWVYFCMYFMMFSAEINFLYGEKIYKKIQVKKMEHELKSAQK